MNPNPLSGRRRPRVPLGETDEERSTRQAIKNEASRARYYLNKRREEDERDARVRDALPLPCNESTSPPANAPAAPVSNFYTGLRMGASLGFPNYARLSRDHDGSNWSLRQWRPLNEAHLKANPMLASHVNKLRASTRAVTNSDKLPFPTNFLPEFVVLLATHPWTENKSVINEEMWAGNPRLFGLEEPIGAHLRINMNDTGVQNFSYAFGENSECVIEVAAVYMAPAQRVGIGELHKAVARHLGAARPFSACTSDEVATESTYIPAGWATMECSSLNIQRPYVDASVSSIRMPYARAHCLTVLPLLLQASPWLGLAANALNRGLPSAQNSSDPESFFQFPPRQWQVAGPHHLSHLKGHQMALKLRGIPCVEADVAARLPSAVGRDYAAMHTDGYDNGMGTIVYLNHSAPFVDPAKACMPHADLVVASGRDGGQLVRIQTFSPVHIIIVRMDFRNCAHSNIAPEEPRMDATGVSQLRILHYSRTEIAQVCKYYHERPGEQMLAGMHGEYLMQQRQRLCPI